MAVTDNLPELGKSPGETFTPQQWNIIRSPGSPYQSATNPREAIANWSRDDPAAMQQAARKFGGPVSTPAAAPIAAAPLPQAAPEATPVPAPAVPQEEGIQGQGTVSVLPLGGTDPRLLRQLSEARHAAADRGDWDSVNRSYGPGGLKGDWVDPSTIARAPEPQSLGDVIQMKWDAAAQGQAARIAAQKQTAAHLGMQTQMQAQNTASEIAHRTAQEAGYASEDALRKAQTAEHIQKAQHEAATYSAKAVMADPNATKEQKSMAQEFLTPSPKAQYYPPQMPGEAGTIFDPYSRTVTRAVATAPTGQTQPTAEHIKTLVANKNNPDIRAKFVAQFGEAAAKQALGG